MKLLIIQESMYVFILFSLSDALRWNRLPKGDHVMLFKYVLPL